MVEKIVILGGAGRLGRTFARKLAGSIPLSRQDADVTKLRSLEDMVNKHQPTTIINCSAYTDVEGAEINRRLAFHLNAIAVSYLGRLAENRNIKLCHFSTDYVFDGNPEPARTLYNERQLPNPINWYGQTKAFGEFNLAACCLSSLVIRTSWLYGDGFIDSFPDKVIERVSKGLPVEIPCDRWVAPTWADDLVDATAKLLDKKASGIVHFSGGEPVSLFEYAQHVAEQQGFSAKAILPTTTALQSAAKRAKRPAFAILDSAYYSELTGEKVPSWRISVSKYLKSKVQEIKT